MLSRRFQSLEFPVVRVGLSAGSLVILAVLFALNFGPETEELEESQVNKPPCKPVRKPDALKQGETSETNPTKHAVVCRVWQGHCIRERVLETAEMRVV